MEKEELLSKLNVIYSNFNMALSDESIMTIGKVLDKVRDKLGDFIQEIEDESNES